MRLLVIFSILAATTAASAITEDLTALSLLIDQLKEEEKAASKEFHAQLSDKIGENIGKIGDRIKGIFAHFNATKDASILSKARADFATNLETGIGKIKQLKDEIYAKRMEAWEANKAKIEQTVSDVSTILSAAKADLIGTAEAAPKDLNAAMNSLTGASSWQTASWLLMLLSVILIATVAVMAVKAMTRNSAGYDKLGGGNNGIFVPTQNP